MTASTTTKIQSKQSPRKKKADANRFTFFPWKYLLVAAIPVCLSAYYLTLVAPELVPIPPGVKVPFPALSGILEEVCAWCGKNPLWVWGIGGGLLLAGCLFRVAIARYYIALTVVVSLALALTWYSVSAPVDRLLKSVEDNLPRDSRFPPADKR